MSRWDWLTSELGRLQEAHLRRPRRVCRPLPNGWCERDGRRLRDFASNDYLNLAGDPRLREAAEIALTGYGVGARASALICGRTPVHEQLEQCLADFEHQPAALLFPTGMAANVGTIAALIHPDDLIFCDRFNHASLIDGCRLSGAKLRIYRHDDLDSLERDLAKQTSARRRWIVTDTVFSMDGDVAPLAVLCTLAERYGAELIVDEAHGTGVFGPTGRGVAEWQQVEHRIAVTIGTLSKALGSLGGFVTGPQELIDYLWNTARTQMFSTALPPAVCAAAIAALEIIQQQPQLVAQLQLRSAYFRKRLNFRDISISASVCGPIVPVIVGDESRTMRIAAELEQRGFLVGAIRPPTVPNGTARLRITVTLAHDEDALTELAEAVAELVDSE